MNFDRPTSSTASTTTAFYEGYWTDLRTWQSAMRDDDPPAEGGEGVREPRRPPPVAPPSVVSLAL